MDFFLFLCQLSTGVLFEDWDIGTYRFLNPIKDDLSRTLLLHVWFVPWFLVYNINIRTTVYSLFNLKTFRVSFRKIFYFVSEYPTYYFIAYHPRNNSIVAIGFEDCAIKIYDLKMNLVIKTLTGFHTKKITSLEFSSLLSMLNSSDDVRVSYWTIFFHFPKSSVTIMTCTFFFFKYAALCLENKWLGNPEVWAYDGSDSSSWLHQIVPRRGAIWYNLYQTSTNVKQR